MECYDDDVLLVYLSFSAFKPYLSLPATALQLQSEIINALSTIQTPQQASSLFTDSQFGCLAPSF
jgi:hypothetical protein